MKPSSLQLTPEMRQALLANPGVPVHIADEATRKVYLLVEQGAIPGLEEEDLRARLEEGDAAMERGDVEEWDSASIKSAGRRMLEQRQQQQ